jgi:hypothetical protein
MLILNSGKGPLIDFHMIVISFAWMAIGFLRYCLLKTRLLPQGPSYKGIKKAG